MTRPWKQTINIKPLIHAFQCGGPDAANNTCHTTLEAKALGIAIADLIEVRALHPQSDDSFELSDALAHLRDPEDVDDLDEALTELYDWADDRRVWLGL